MSQSTSPPPPVAPSPTSSSVSIPSSSLIQPDHIEETSEQRPHAPVAKTLNKQELKHTLSAAASSTSSPSNEIIPNLLHSGKFPPPPRSPRHHHRMSHSPPPIMNNVDFSLGSPVYPAAPPSTPYSPHMSKSPALTNLSLPPSDPHSPLQYKISHRPSPLPSPHKDEHYQTLLQQYISKATSEEKSRITTLTTHEKSYTLSEIRHALTRERRHSLALTQELAHYKFLSRYQSCSLYSEAEINEEAKVNLLIKNMEGIIKSKDEDKIKTVMELEREEERMINVLMGRLESVNREKNMLERQIYGTSGGRRNRFESMEGVELVVPGPPLSGSDGGKKKGVEEHKNDQVDENHTASEPKQTDKEGGIVKCNEEEEEEDEEEEDKEDQDILQDKFHDPEMEAELENLLEKKGVDK